MAAGLGFKDFTTGEVLTAADVDGYLMQGIWVFASEAARNAAVTSPQEGNFAFTKDNNSLWYYDGAAWVASGAAGDIEGVTAGVGISGGGTSGTVTITNSMATAIDAKGDLIVGTGADTFSRLAVGGTNGHTLQVDSSTSTGLKWAAAAGGGGYTFIGTTTFSSTGTVSVNSVFSDTYDLYRVYITTTGQTGATLQRLRFRTSGSDNTNANYTYQNFNSASTSNVGVRSINNTYVELAYSTGGSSLNAIDFAFPYNNDKEAMLSFVSANSLDYGAIDVTGARFGANTSFDGFTFYTSSGTFTAGTITVYGLAKS